MALKFSLVGTRIPTGATIDSAKIMLYSDGQYNPGNGLTQDVHRITEVWGSTLRWDSPTITSRDPVWIANNTTPVTIDPAPAASFIVPNLSAASSNLKWVSFNVTNVIKTFWANPSSNNGFLIKGRTGGSEMANVFMSSENVTIANRPKLIVWSRGGTPAGINQAGMTMASRAVSVKSNTTGVVLSGFAGNASDVSVGLFDMQGKSVAYTRADNIGTIQLTTHGTIGSRVLLASVRVGNSGESIKYKVIQK